MSKSRKKTIVAVGVVLIATFGLYRYVTHRPPAVASQTATQIDTEDEATRDSSIAEVIEIATKARDVMSTSLNDYTARFVKQEATGGVLGEEGEIFMKVHTRFRNENDDAPMRVYLRFDKPDSTKGREVIWGDDLYDGNMQVKEAGLLGMMTLSLDPKGPVAMMGQRYPISEIGLKRLIEKLIERGKEDLDNPDVSVTITKDHKVGDVDVQLIQVRRAKPTPDDDEDFSLAEVAYDSDRMLIVQYRSFGWPEEDAEDQSPPLQESYTYHDIKTNVGLTEKDFDTTNSEYSFP